MHFPTPQEIQSMRSNGYDPSVIAPLEEKCLRAEPVRNAIRAAFAGVTLGNGVGLFQGQALDAYADEARQAQARAQDEKDDWSRIPARRLCDCHSSLSFFDSEGLRFHLPAFMLAELAGEFGFDLFFHLEYDHADRFALLDVRQRTAVRDYLTLTRDEWDSGRSPEHVDRIIRDVWCD